MANIYDNGLNPALPGYKAPTTTTTSTPTTTTRTSSTSSGGYYVSPLTGTKYISQEVALQYEPALRTGATSNPTTSATGDPTLDGVLQELDKYIQTQAANGSKFNPNIELTPDVVKQFLDQATKEISPYYAGQINAVKDQLTNSLSNLQKNYDLQKENQLASFQKNLSNTRENLAAGGAAYSGFRGQQEQNLAQGVDRSLTGLGLDTAASANNALSTARQAVGSTGLPKLPTFSGYTADTTGTGSFTPTRSLDFNTFSAPLTGELQYNQNRDITNLTDYLKQQEVNKRVLSF